MAKALRPARIAVYQVGRKCPHQKGRFRSLDRGTNSEGEQQMKLDEYSIDDLREMATAEFERSVIIAVIGTWPRERSLS